MTNANENKGLQKEGNKVMVSVATDKITIDDFRVLVFEQYGERKWLDKREFPDGRVYDKYDESSDVLVVKYNNEVVAGMRIVKDSEYGFPHEDSIGLKHFIKDAYYENELHAKIAKTSRDKIAEITKLVGKKKERMLTIDLAKCIYWYAIHNNIDLYVMVIDKDFFRLCSVLGIPIHPIGEEVYCEGSMTLPAIINIAEFSSSIPKRSTKYWQYIQDEENVHCSILGQKNSQLQAML